MIKLGWIAASLLWCAVLMGLYVVRNPITLEERIHLGAWMIAQLAAPWAIGFVLHRIFTGRWEW
jgi:hypothetical protein